MFTSRRGYAFLGAFTGCILGLSISAVLDVLTDAKKEDALANEELADMQTDLDNMASSAYGCTCTPAQ